MTRPWASRSMRSASGACAARSRRAARSSASPWPVFAETATMGAPYVLVTISSTENLARLDRLIAIAALLRLTTEEDQA